jgi:hypothetical protein
VPTADTQLIVHEPAPLPAVSESASLLQVIERMAVNPAVDVEKLERLMAMHERIVARNAKASYNAAFAELQPNLPVITEKGEIKIRDVVQSRYAKWEDIVQTITPILGAHGFGLSFRVGRDGDRQTVTGILSHRDGHSEETTLALPLDMSGSKNNVQGVGSTTSYGKRYVTQALLNLVSRGEDDDGQGAGGDPTISDVQKAELVAMLQETKADVPKFLQYMAVASLDEIKAANFNRARSALQAKKAKAS